MAGAEAENEQPKVDRPGFAQCHSNPTADPTHLSGKLLSREGGKPPVENFDGGDTYDGSGKVENGNSASLVGGNPGNRSFLISDDALVNNEHQSETESEAEPESGESETVAEMAALLQGNERARNQTLADTATVCKPVIERGAQAVDTGVKPAADTAQIYNFNTEKAKRLSPLDATQTPMSDTDVKGAQTPVSNPLLTQVSKRVKRTPIHLLDIERADSVGSGHGRSVRLRLRSPDPDSGKMSRYYTWVPNDEWEAFRSTFNWREAVNASRKIDARRQAIRRSVRSAGNDG